MNKGQRLYKFILGLLMPFLFLACSSKERIKIDGGTFNVDGKDVQLICGEMHNARIPHEYWRDRLKGTCHGIEYNISLCVLELSRTTAR